MILTLHSDGVWTGEGLASKKATGFDFSFFFFLFFFSVLQQ